MTSKSLKYTSGKQYLKIIKLNKIIKTKDDLCAQKIDEIKSYYESIISLMPGNVYWLDKNNVYLGCNNLQASNANLKSTKDITGKSNYDLPWREQAEELNRVNNLVMQTGKILTYEEDALMMNGMGTYLSQKAPLRDKDNNIIGVVGISIDITDRKKMELELDAAKIAAEAANHVKTEFIANMSHDIRTPLSGVVGLGNIVEKEVSDPEVKSKIHDMVKSAEELLNMLNEVLDVISLDDISMSDIQEEAFNVSDLVQKIIDLESSSVDSKNLKLLQYIDSEIPNTLIGDYKKIHII